MSVKPHFDATESVFLTSEFRRGVVHPLHKLSWGDRGKTICGLKVVMPKSYCNSQFLPEVLLSFSRSLVSFFSEVKHSTAFLVGSSDGSFSALVIHLQSILKMPAWV